jgi:hypothetical protein
MLILPQIIKNKWNVSNRDWYIQKGYNYTKLKDEFEINVLDLKKGSHNLIKLKCDYCDVIFYKEYKSYLYGRRIIGKDCCENLDCIKQKRYESNKLIYGVGFILQIDEIKNSRIKTNLEKYGCEYASQSKIVKEKIKQTNLIKYGFSTSSKNRLIHQKGIITLKGNNNDLKSKQQIYIHKLIGGEINYQFSNLLLDIGFENEMIYVEYDGGGHDLRVKLGSMTKDKFIKEERKRECFLRDNNWKVIRIISYKDYLPQDNKIIEMINYAKDYLNTKHSWIHFNIDNQLVKCSQFENYYDFGELRKIK